jgi:AraC-like DNA-binding protein
LAILLIGYSIFAALVLALTHFRAVNYVEQRSSQAAGVMLLGALAALQAAHFAYLQHGLYWIEGPLYRVLLFAVAPAFYLFAKPLLHAPVRLAAAAVHFVPVAAAPLVPYRWALPLAFAIGAVYLLWLARSVYALRAERSRFRVELALLAAVFAIAVVVFVLGVSLPWIGDRYFFVVYSSAVGCAFLLVSLVLARTPKLSTEVAEAAREAYAVSTLTHVDCAAVLAKLDALMQEQRAFEDADLDLAALAARAELSPHQLSELINTRLGKSFSRFLRERRVAAARRMLTEAPHASVLSVGLSVGFTSQSNFYEAFREITGMTPGRYRKLRAQDGTANASSAPRAPSAPSAPSVPNGPNAAK